MNGINCDIHIFIFLNCDFQDIEGQIVLNRKDKNTIFKFLQVAFLVFDNLIEDWAHFIIYFI